METPKTFKQLCYTQSGLVYSVEIQLKSRAVGWSTMIAEQLNEEVEKYIAKQKRAK